MEVPFSVINDIGWPAIPSTSAATKLALQFQLKQSQWWSGEELFEHQLEQLSLVLNHASKTVPFYKDFYLSESFKPKRMLTFESFSKIPFLSRDQVQQAGIDLISINIPRHHGNVYDVSTSGSTGKTVHTKTTDITRFFWNAFTLRDHLWHNRNVNTKLAAIRTTTTKETLPPNGQVFDSWGPATVDLYKTGPASLLSIHSSIDEQWEWLKNQNPETLLTYPSNLKAIIDKSLKDGCVLSNLRDVSTLGEVVSAELRKAVKDAWGVPLLDIYSCNEVGYMALQCPDYDHYHVQSENIILEVLDDNDKPCKVGEVGRVVVTTLHNYATPLIRYELGDYAEVGEPCPCGRGLPVLERIVGRVRNLVTYPDGTKARPLVGSDSFKEVAEIRQFQFIQKTVNDIELKLVVNESLNYFQKQSLISIIQKMLRYEFNIDLTCHEEIPRSPGGEYEDFISFVN